LATIPKYVYEDLKSKANQKVNRIVDEIIEPLRERIEKEKKDMENELVSNITNNIKKFKTSVQKNYRSSYIEIDIPKEYHNKMYKKFRDLDNKLNAIKTQIHEDLHEQVDTWLLSIYSKASDNQVIKLPEFKIDKGKYKLWLYIVNVYLANTIIISDV